MSKQFPIISVIVPVYNAEDYILESINSVLTQTHQNFELIVVNDGSTDGTNKILASINNSRLKVLEIENSGQCAAANYGINFSQGKYIKFLDADDIMNECHLAEMLAVADESEDSLVLCKWARFYSSIETAVFKHRPEWSSFESSMDWFITALSNGPDMLPLWQWLIPRKLIEKAGGWNENLGLGNDFEYSSRLLKYSYGVKFCNDAWIYYRSGLKTNMSSDNSSKTINSVFKSIENSELQLLDINSSSDLKGAFSNKYFAWLIDYYPFLNDCQIKAADFKISNLGKPTYKVDWGWKFNVLKNIFGWKYARILQYKYYQYKHV